MLAEENKERYIQVVKELNECKGDIAKIRSMFDEYCKPGYVNHNSHRGDMNLNQTAQYYSDLWTAFPDLILSIDDIVAEENKLVVRCTARGTHEGIYMGIPPTGKQVVTRAWQFSRMVEGKIMEVWELADGLNTMIQLGVVPGAVPVK